MKIKLKNFQAYRSAEFEFGPGFTLITGPTDTGKTSIFRAVIALLTNSAKAARYINGASLKEDENAELVVTLTDSDIPRIEFHRTKTKAWYMIDNKKYSKLARTNIFDLYPELHSKFIYNEEDPRKILNFQTEAQLEFPFDRSDTEMFKLFERVFNITDTRTVIDTIKKEEEETNFKINQNSVEKNNLEAKQTVLDSALKSINKELITSYVEKQKLLQGKSSVLEQKIRTIPSYVAFLKTALELPSMSASENDEHERVQRLAIKLKDCQEKQAFINNYQEVQFSETSEDLKLRATELAGKINSIQNLELAISAQEQYLEGASIILSDIEKELEQFKVCPLCGHELGEK